MPPGKAYGKNVNMVSNKQTRAKAQTTPKETGGGESSLITIDSSLRMRPQKGA